MSKCCYFFGTSEIINNFNNQTYKLKRKKKLSRFSEQSFRPNFGRKMSYISDLIIGVDLTYHKCKIAGNYHSSEELGGDFIIQGGITLVVKWTLYNLHVIVQHHLSFFEKCECNFEQCPSTRDVTLFQQQIFQVSLEFRCCLLLFFYS